MSFSNTWRDNLRHSWTTRNAETTHFQSWRRCRCQTPSLPRQNFIVWILETLLMCEVCKVWKDAARNCVELRKDRMKISANLIAFQCISPMVILIFGGHNFHRCFSKTSHYGCDCQGCTRRSGRNGNFSPI